MLPQLICQLNSYIFHLFELNQSWLIIHNIQSTMECVCVYVCISHSVVSDSLQPHGLKSSVHGVSQASTLEWVAISFSRGSFPPRERTQVFFTAGRFFTVWAIREAPKDYYYISMHRVLKKKKSVSIATSEVKKITHIYKYIAIKCQNIVIFI